MKGASKQSDETSTAQAERIELTGLFTMMLGVWYPRGYVVAAIDPAHGHKAEKALLEAGFGTNAVRHEPGSRVLEIRETITNQRTPFQRAAVNVAVALTDEGMLSQHYFDAAEMGASVIAVLAPEPGHVNTAKEVLAAHGARRIRFYGDKAIIDL
jgi:hypothetical protein